MILLAMKYMEAPITTLVVKDRVTGHNPVAAIYNAESYFEKNCLIKMKNNSKTY